MYFKKIGFYCCSLFFLIADGCLCRPSVKQLYKALKQRKYVEILTVLEDDTINILQCPPRRAWRLKKMFLYRGLFTQEEIQEHKEEALDLIESAFRKHYQRRIDWYWQNDPEHYALQIILMRDNIELFDSLMHYDPAREFIQSAEGRELFTRSARGDILEKYGVFLHFSYDCDILSASSISLSTITPSVSRPSSAVYASVDTLGSAEQRS